MVLYSAYYRSTGGLARQCMGLLQSLCLLLILTVVGGNAVAQGFDPSKVDWEALSKIPMRDGFIKQFNEQKKTDISRLSIH